MNVSMIPIASANSLSPANIAPTSRTPNPVSETNRNETVNLQLLAIGDFIYTAM